MNIEQYLAACLDRGETEHRLSVSRTIDGRIQVCLYPEDGSLEQAADYAVEQDRLLPQLDD